MTAIQVPMYTERYHFYKAQKHAKIKNTLFRNAYMCSKTVKKDKYKIQADGYLYEGEGKTELFKPIFRLYSPVLSKNRSSALGVLNV